MEYKLNTTNYRDFKVIEDNKLAGRAYFIPYSKKEKLLSLIHIFSLDDKIFL